MLGTCLVYSIYIYGICSSSGFRGQHHSRPDPVPQNILDDVLPDPDDMADFELPDQQALIDACLDGLCKESDHEFYLHKRVAAAIAQGHFTIHNMRESDRDGDQDLTFWIRSLEEVLQEALGDERMADPDAVFPFRNTEEVHEKVAQEHRRLLHRDGTPRDRCKAEVCYIRSKYVIY
jgi:hypothetical protein